MTTKTTSTLTPDAGPSFLATMLSPSDPWTLFYRLNFPTRFRLGHYGHMGVYDLPPVTTGLGRGLPRALICDECDQGYDFVDDTWVIADDRIAEWDGAGAFGDATLPIHPSEEPCGHPYSRYIAFPNVCILCVAEVEASLPRKDRHAV